METPSSLTPETPQVALPKTTAHHSRHIVYGVLLGAIAVMMVFASTIIFGSRVLEV